MSVFETVRAALISARPRQWVKNTFLFAAPLFGRRLGGTGIVTELLLAFALFSVAASATYLLNDVVDRERDRHHPDKRRRPVAAGQLGVTLAVCLAVSFYLVALSGSFLLSISLGLVVSGYVLLNLAYSLLLKRVILVDVVCISLFFVLRVMAGAAVAGVILSPWIILGTVLLALMIALGKRYHELAVLQEEAARHRETLSGYSLTALKWLVRTTALMVAVFYSFYPLFSYVPRSQRFFVTVPLVYLGLWRYLDSLFRHQRGDPTEMAWQDPVLQAVLILWLGGVLWAVYL